MIKRRQISQRVRFRVFERDGFRCQYCGRGTPEVVLEVDHVIPVARGGPDDTGNLLTACKACNIGKTDSTLKAPTDPKARLKEAREREAQIVAYRAVTEATRARKANELKWIEDNFRFYFGWKSLHPNETATVKNYLERIDVFELQRCIEIAIVRVQTLRIWNEDKQWRYWCGVVRGREQRRQRGETE